MTKDLPWEVFCFGAYWSELLKRNCFGKGIFKLPGLSKCQGKDQKKNGCFSPKPRRKAKNLEFKGNSGRFRDAKRPSLEEIFAVAKISLHIGLGFGFLLFLVVIWL